MQVLYFLKERTKFIRQYYETASAPFQEIMRKIEAGEAPFIPGDDAPEDEPPFLEEWMQAKTSVEILGRTCVSMLSESLKLYFQTWESELSVKWAEDEKKEYFKEGFVKGYKRCFGELLNLRWDECPVEFDILEQIALARNSDQHPDSITTMQVYHRPPATTNFTSLFFLSATEKAMYAMPDFTQSSWFQPTVHVSRDQLLAAVEQVELLGDWLEDRMLAAR